MKPSNASHVRSRSRGRAESLLCNELENSIKEVLQRYLQDFGLFWNSIVLFVSSDLAEWCYVSGSHPQAPMTKAEIRKRKEINFQQLSRHEQQRFAAAAMKICCCCHED
eukprot:1074281-Amphidinium_carterae.3